jgi:aryl-alcohol dehydrogenase-like predicted oxidoreductase
LGISISQLAIAWTLNQPYVLFPIVGATTVHQLEENMKANEIKLSQNDLREIEKAYAKLEKRIRDDYNLAVHEFRGLNEKFY